MPVERPIEKSFETSFEKSVERPESESGMEIGVDIIEIDRIAAAAENPRFLERVYTVSERSRCMGRKNPAEELAGRFASKEAVIKCLGRRVPWKSIEVLNEPSGKPYVKLYGIAETLAAGRRIALSISHSRSYAVASAIMEDGDDVERSSP